ncbi:hypothetical protein J4429_05040 [Candidatus Pacearchaeota archaeon]|nr:hypothetical protein [Candidatus Pacearchaeota archaeon]
MKKLGKKDIKKIVYSFLIILLIILLFTLGDYFMHLLKDEYSVPSYYFKNKLIFGTIIGSFVFIFIRKMNLLKKSLIFSLLISIFLQIRYFLEGYSKDFVFLFLFIHFLILFITSLIIFKISDKYIKTK